jgi:hypothetical protein
MNFTPQLTRRVGFLATLLLTTALLCYNFSGLLKDLRATQCTEPYRDGIKTYLNVTYHAKFDSTFTWFGGMNYPYPEHIVAATELPGVCIAVKLLHNWFPKLTDYSFGIVHLVLLFSMLGCALLLYLIFTKLGMPAWFSLIVAIGLTFLAPQNMRFGAHSGLAPPFVLPAVIYGLLRYEKDGDKWTTSLFLALVVIVSSLMHFYFFAMTTLLISGYFFFSFILNFDKKRLAQWLPHYAVMIFVPFLLFYFWMIANDPVSDRSAKPWGFLHYRAKWESLFTSLHLPLYQWIDKHIIKIETTDFEGWSYVGMVAGAFVLAGSARWLFSKFKKPLLDFFTPEERRFYYPLLFAGIGFALFACAQPFAIKGLEHWLEYAGPLRQFRSTGRFGWGFYFAINIIAFAGFYRLISQHKKLIVRALWHILLLGVLCCEAWAFANSPFMYDDKRLVQVEELVPGKRFTDLPGIEWSKYQAVLPVPYYFIGSNNFDAQGGAMAVQKSLILSTQTGLPSAGAMLTRASRRQCFDQNQLMGEPYRVPEIFKDYKSAKPLLLLYSKHLSDDDRRHYDHLLQETRLLHETKDWALYEMELAAFGRRIEKRQSAVLKTLERDSLRRFGRIFSTDSVENFTLQSFDDRSSRQVYLGKGAYEGILGNPNLVFKGKIPRSQPGAYRLLAWVWADDDLYNQIYMRIREKDEQGNVRKESAFGVQFQALVFDPNGWILVDCPFDLQAGDSVLEVELQSFEPDKRPLWVDELLIKPAPVSLYRLEADLLWQDNRYWRR